MLFNSTTFLLWFLPITLLLYGICKGKRTALLLIANYIFYGWWNPAFCLLMLFSTCVDYIASARIYRSDSPQKRKLFLIIALVINLALLGFFKYYVLLSETINALTAIQWLPTWKIVLPVGISFYTFQSMSYTIDIYRRKTHPARNFFDFACYVSLFPQLVAGPIIRYKEIADQLVERTHSYEKIARGLQRFILGLAKKVIIADACAVIANDAFAAADLSTPHAWLGILAYTFQIYYDFSGYSDMAIGLGLMMGFQFPENFNLPYLSKSIGDFWRRWHMTLGNWFRDYVYFPLGGSREGIPRTLANLLATMFLAGLWHGASWTFVVWGLYFGVLMVMERVTQNFRKAIPTYIQIATTFFFVVMGWVLFRSISFAEAIQYYKSLFVWNDVTQPISTAMLVTVGIVGLCTLLEPYKPRIFSQNSIPSALLYAALFIVCLITVIGNQASPFLYFQF